MTLSELITESHRIAVSKGWWDLPVKNGVLIEKSVGESIALMHSELSEALEEYRKNKAIGEIYYSENCKPEGFLVEIADLLIRVGDFIGHHKLTDELEFAISEKMGYNATRQYRHGGKAC